MEVLSYDISGVRVVRIRGALTEQNLQAFTRQIYANLSGRDGAVLLNLEFLERLTPLATAAVHELVRKLRREGAPLGLVPPAGPRDEWEILVREDGVCAYGAELEGIQTLAASGRRRPSGPTRGLSERDRLSQRGRLDPDPDPSPS